ncbi:MAG TPA: protein-L-isoaspartate O-methyltransferase [Candidatus Saccharimonadales bacterium]|nr:protein-L-isoaspartate O-methyltransferase [Candidatus Saccharimonadales bacterium]
MDVLEQAFIKIHRKNFVPDSLLNQAEIDAPLPIGFGQTISQPTTVQLMLTWLAAQPGEKVLDIGSGSGWTTALLSQIVGSKGSVLAVEKISELVELGRNNCARVGIQNAKFFQSSKQLGLSKFSPYDRILVSASAHELPEELILKLKVGGKLVIPVQNDILEITKKSKNEYETKTHTGFVFVPLVK